MNANAVFTPEKYEALGRAHAKAIRDEEESFTFDGHPLLTAYAGYLLDFLSQRFGPLPPPGYTSAELERDNPYNQWMYED